jgi:hypothetical protein
MGHIKGILQGSKKSGIVKVGHRVERKIADGLWGIVCFAQGPADLLAKIQYPPA